MKEALPRNYTDLANEGAPKILVEALKEFGTIEVPGKDDSPTIMGWASELGMEQIYTDDAIPWCGLFMAVIAKRAGKQIVKDPLWAANWKKFGVPVPEAGLGDVLVFTRPGGNHVGIYVGEDDLCYHVLGGNQSDKVCISRILRRRCTAIRRPVFKIAPPANIRKIVRGALGRVSENEA